MEHILLNSTLHENDEYSYEKIVLWLNKLLSVNFLGRDIIDKQLSGAEYKVQGKHEYISVKFIANSFEKYPYGVRVPISMQAKQDDGNIVDFLLHVINGFVDEMEIYNMDLTEIYGDFSLDDIVHSVNKKVQPRGNIR